MKKLPVRSVLLIALACGLTTFVVALLADSLLSDWPHSRRGAVVGGWFVFALCMAAAAAKILRRDERRKPPKQ